MHRVERVLDVRQGQLCWVAGTVYLDMPLKPNILDDISRDVSVASFKRRECTLIHCATQLWIAAPPPREKYLSIDGQDKVMLEDESGRLQLTGIALQSELLVTGCIIAVMGTENANGDFEVIDIKLPEMPQQLERWESETKNVTGETMAMPESKSGSKVAIISGLDINGELGNSLVLDLFMEWILGESSSPSMQTNAAQISRLIIAGNSLAEASPLSHDDHLPSAGAGSKRAAAAKKYGYDSSAFNPAPTAQLDLFLSTLLPSIPITLIPGPSDPANVSLPQQPLHPALFPQSRVYTAAPPNKTPAESTIAGKSGSAHRSLSEQESSSFHSTTNPTLFTVAGHLFLGNGGQPISDIAKYVDKVSTLDLMEHTLRWRLVAPTAPDTLWCYPYQDDDPFVLADGECPHVYFVGNQKEFGTSIVEGIQGQRVRCVSVPRFSERGEVVIVDLETLGVEIVKFEVFDGAG